MTKKNDKKKKTKKKEATEKKEWGKGEEEPTKNVDTEKVETYMS